MKEHLEHKSCSFLGKPLSHAAKRDKKHQSFQRNLWLFQSLCLKSWSLLQMHVSTSSRQVPAYLQEKKIQALLPLLAFSTSSVSKFIATALAWSPIDAFYSLFWVTTVVPTSASRWLRLHYCTDISAWCQINSACMNSQNGTMPEKIEALNAHWSWGAGRSCHRCNRHISS